MNVKELMAELIWKMRFLDPFFYATVIFLRLKKAGKDEKEEVLRAIYDIRVNDQGLSHLKKDYLARLFIVSLFSLVILFFIFLLLTN